MVAIVIENELVMSDCKSDALLINNSVFRMEINLWSTNTQTKTQTQIHAHTHYWKYSILYNPSFLYFVIGIILSLSCEVYLNQQIYIAYMGERRSSHHPIAVVSYEPDASQSLSTRLFIQQFVETNNKEGI